MNEEKLLLWLFDRYRISENNRASIMVYLSFLGQRSEETRRHCIRVGYAASEIGSHCEIEEIKPKVLVWAGLLHDPGKALVDPDLLERKEKFTAADYERMKAHVEYGYRMLRGIHEWTAHIVVRHHRFGPDPYPELPPLPPYLAAKEELIDTYARLLALADYYDAITHRDNDKFGGGLSAKEKRERCLRDNSDQAALVIKLEKEGVLIFQ